MDISRFTQYDASTMILRDHLALERTAMANERTLLSYVRTMIGIMAVGGTLLKLFTGILYFALGWSLIGLGFFLLIVGFFRYLRIETILSNILQPEPEFHTKDRAHLLVWDILQKLHLARVKFD